MDAVKPNVHTFEVTGLMEGSNYIFRVFAENAEGVSNPLESDVPVTCRRAPGSLLFFVFYFKKETIRLL